MMMRIVLLVFFVANFCLAQTHEATASSTNGAAAMRAEFLTLAGLKYADEGELEEAERAYLRALEMDPDNPNVRFRLGTLYVKMENYPAALAEFETLVEEFPHNAAARNNLAWSYVTAPGIKNTKKAFRHIREGLLSSPHSASLWNTLAEVYFISGDYERAERTAEHAIDMLSLTPGAGEEQQASFYGQLYKIQRAREARELLEGLDDDD
jgi:tetratricopeptide (TPR) repeat protein